MINKVLREIKAKIDRTAIIKEKIGFNPVTDIVNNVSSVKLNPQNQTLLIQNKTRSLLRKESGERLLAPIALTTKRKISIPNISKIIILPLV